jgi:hypothetical protein
LALDESVLAGVPVIALARGALSDRVRELEAGWLVPPEEGDVGVAAKLEELSRTTGIVGVPDSSRRRVLELRRVAQESMRGLYDELG